MTQTDTTNSARFIMFGAAARGGKIHRSDEGAVAGCLNGNGFSKLVNVFAKVDMDWDDFDFDSATEEELEARKATREARWATMQANELAAVTEANVPMGNLCKKCCGHLIAGA